MTEVARSINGVPIRLTDERWRHIVTSHNDMASYYDDCLRVIEQPDLILRGDGGTLRAVKSYGKNSYMQVTYRELTRDDGFVILAYFIRRVDRRNILWQR